MSSAINAMATSTKALLLYDGECPMCRKSVQLLKRLDWFGVLSYRSARNDDPLPETQSPLRRERLLEEMHLVTRAGVAHHGFGAFRWLAWRVPLLIAVAPLLYLPGIPKLGQRLYLWIARNRFNLMPCRHGVCSVPERR